MLKRIISTLAAFSLIIGALHAETAKSAASKAADKTKEAAKTVADKGKEAADKAKETVKKPAAKPAAAESDSDKALKSHATKEAEKLTPTQSGKLLELANTGDAKALQTMPGVGETKAAAIKKARPWKSVPDLIMVDGIGEGTYDEIIAWAKKGMPAEAAKAEKPEAKEAKAPAKKAETKPAETPKKTAEKAADKPAEEAKKGAEKATKTTKKAADKVEDAAKKTTKP